MSFLGLLSIALTFPRADVDFGGGGGEVPMEPIRAGDRSARESLPSLEASPKFLLFHHPRQWAIRMVNGSPELFPQVAHVAIEPGTGGVDEYGDPSGAGR